MAPCDLDVDKQQYYMGTAFAVRERANCTARKVGAVIVLENRIIATGYNGTPERMKNCLDGGCFRCSRTDLFKSGEGYDVCICVHAEQNALLTAARFGISAQGASLFTALTPCFGCAKELLQAGIECLYYRHPWAPTGAEQRRQHKELLNRIHTVEVDVVDPREDWANNTQLQPPAGVIDETGHEAQYLCGNSEELS